ncbi:MAG: efflux RND transporter periplasmic adaptor subunit [Parvularculaceae bacterium]
MKAPRSRVLIILGGLVLVGAFLAFTFWPRPFLVDFARTKRGSMSVTIDEEGKTRVKERYVVAAPITGRLLRIEIDPGDEVVVGDTVIAEMTPVLPAALDVRTEEQADAAVAAAKAALALAIAEEKRAKADSDFAFQEASRARALFKTNTIARQALDRSQAAAASATAAREAAGAVIVMRRAELAQAEKLLMTPTEAARAAAGNPHPPESIPIRAPVSGHVLQIFQESEATVPAGAPLLEIGDPHTDLEVVIELLSTDAVRVNAGDPVIIDKWGGDEPFAGVVERIEPLAFTKISALGVEEQRVNTIIRLEGPRIDVERLGHGFRVEARVIIWSDEDAMIAPAAALFRSGDKWAVYKVEKGRARQSALTVGHNNGLDAEILDGLSEGDQVILFPGADIADGVLVAPRPQAAR